MYSDKLEVANKIISYNDLIDIFNKMYEDLEKYKKLYKNEEMRNRPLEYSYQKWSFKDSSSSLHFRVSFYDNTDIKFDNYNNFITVFNTRLEEIKSIYVWYNLNYSTTSTDYFKKNEYHSQKISMYIYEDKISIEFSLDSTDKKMEEVYELIKTKVLNAPEKYDNVIKKKSSIVSTVGLAIGFIPALIICTLFLFVPTIRILFSHSYVLYPICCMLMAFVLGGMIGSSMMDELYKNIVPKKKYVSYEKGYKDDIDKFVGTSEVLIGKNVHNLDDRKKIMMEYEKYKKYIPYEILLLVVLSIIVILIGILFK